MTTTDNRIAILINEHAKGGPLADENIPLMLRSRFLHHVCAISDDYPKNDDRRAFIALCRWWADFLSADLESQAAEWLNEAAAATESYVGPAESEAERRANVDVTLIFVLAGMAHGLRALADSEHPLHGKINTQALAETAAEIASTVVGPEIMDPETELGREPFDWAAQQEVER